jgi:hypothetical protein
MSFFKRCVVFLFLLFLGTSFNSIEIESSFGETDVYKVIRVNGEIQFEKSGDLMKRGDLFTPKMRINFLSSTSRAALISKTNGCIVLSPKSSNNLKANLIPAMENLSSRAGAGVFLNKVNLQNYFKDTLMILGKQSVKVSSTLYPIDDKRFFYLKFMYKGLPVYKQLIRGEENSFVLSHDNIFSIDKKEVVLEELEMELHYRDTELKKTEFISSFTPIFPNEKELLREYDFIKKNTGKGKSKNRDVFAAFLNEFYGVFDRDNMETFLNVNKR